MERSLFIIKPDAVQRGLIGEIIARVERRGIKLIGAKLVLISPELAARHYAVHRGKPFYDGLIAFITSAPVMLMVWEGTNAVRLIRQTAGATNPAEAAPGTIRHDMAKYIQLNLVHASDSPENGEREVELFFKPDELVSWERTIEAWVSEII